MRVDHSVLEAWQNRPITRAEREQIAAAAKANSIIHRFDCLCDPCSGRRRALVSDQPCNQARLLSAGERRGLRITNNIMAAFGFVVMAFIVVLLALHAFLP